ncbi:transglycosylase SLT domain-containing protein [Dyella humi]|uniref:Transglycosylase SLT domain-containing protein n=1 Tax=Dyella humi TaxID=1770547 RepID=A0ABW8IGS2_9GAMM
MNRPEVTQRVYLCAPAAFRARRMGGPTEKIVIAAPCGWARRRRIAERHPHAGVNVKGPAGMAALPSWQAKLAIDASKLLPVIKQHAQTYRTPILGGLGLVAGTAAVVIGLHAWHAEPKAHVSLQAMSVAKPAVITSPARSSASFVDVTGSVVNTPTHVAAIVKPKQAPKTTLGLSDDGTIVVVAQPRASHADGFNLDITSSGSLWAKTGAHYRIDPVLIYAVALVETRGTQPDGSVAPSPWIVRINGHLHSGTRAQTEHAIELAHLLAVPVQDVGIMQVYYPVHRDIEPDPIALLNPARNIEIGTRLLRKAMGESSDPVLRIGYYHSHDATLARGYGQLVLSVYKELKMAMGKSPSAAVALESMKGNAAQPGG